MPSSLSAFLIYAAGAVFFLSVGVVLAFLYLHLRARRVVSDKESESETDSDSFIDLTVQDADTPARRPDRPGAVSPEREFQSLVENMPVGVFRVGLANEVSYANEKFFEIFGIPFEEGNPPADWMSFILEGDRGKVSAAVDETKLSFRETKTVVRIRTVGGETRQVSFHFSAAISDNAVHFVGVVGDLGGISLPGVQENRGGEEKASDTSSKGSGGRTAGKVLLAEDNAVNQKIVHRMIESLGLSCDVAGNGLEAVEMWKQGAYELVLLDCQMPHMDGIEAARVIRRMEDGIRRTPIVALTAQALGDDPDRCLAAGMDECIPKPVTQERLQAVIERIGLGQPSKRSMETTGSVIDENPVLDVEVLRQASAGDHRLEGEMLDLFLIDTRRRLERMAPLVAERSDLVSVCREAEAIKGACGTVGATALKEVAYRLEKASAEGDLSGVRQMYDLLRSEFGRVDEVIAKYRRTVLSGPGA